MLINCPILCDKHHQTLTLHQMSKKKQQQKAAKAPFMCANSAGKAIKYMKTFSAVESSASLVGLKSGDFRCFRTERRGKRSEARVQSLSFLQ